MQEAMPSSVSLCPPPPTLQILRPIQTKLDVEERAKKEKQNKEEKRNPIGRSKFLPFIKAAFTVPEKQQEGGAGQQAGQAGQRDRYMLCKHAKFWRALDLQPAWPIPIWMTEVL